ncbi:MAG: hypothetical protein GY715_19935 [Planctomycetes bacterium]|nr:hypothetical protein [Planctomycetota bacterium]
MNSTRTIVLVGHCGPDMFMLKTAVSRAVGAVPIESINDAETLAPHLHGKTVLLVNRVLDGAFPSDSGIDLIGEVADGADAPTCILISNLPEAQERAIAAGAMPGFGKNALYDATTAEILREAAE